jgi:hypothetical protein
MHVDNQCIQVYLANTSSFILRVGGKGGGGWGGFWLHIKINYLIV